MKAKGFIIREFSIDDYENIVGLWNEGGIHYRPNGRESRPQREKEIKSGQTILLVAEAERRIVAVVLGTHNGRIG